MKFPFFPWEEANAPAWVYESDEHRKSFLRHARSSGASVKMREEWALEHPEEWAKWEAAWERGDWHPEGWKPAS